MHTEVTFKMNSMKKSLLLFAVLLLVLVPAVLAQDTTTNTIPATVAANGSLNTLAAAVEAAGLSDTLSSGEWTVFAPTDQAFAAIGVTADNVADMDTADLSDILLYHVMSGDLSTANLKGMLGNVTMANGQQAGLSFYEDDIYVNDMAKVIEPNILGGNGRIQIVDAVIQGPWPRVDSTDTTVQEALQEIANMVSDQMEGATEEAAASDEMAAEGGETMTDETGMPTEVPSMDTTVDESMAADTTSTEAVAPTIPEGSIAGIAVMDGRFDTVVAAAVASGLVDDLAGGEWTAFVPTDEAFAKLGLTPDNIASEFTQQELADLLLYHLMEGDLSTAQLKGMLGNVIMANGQQAGLKYYEDNIYVNDDSKVIEENIVTDNGTIHVVDNVILPPWPRVDTE
jgi:transforming growth factor-beta-induced protein